MLRHAACLCILSTLSAAELQREAHTVDGEAVTVSSKSELTIGARDDADVKSRELWYARHDGTRWGAWQKHGLSFTRETPITWSPPEGHWRIFVRIEEVSGLRMPAPTADTSPAAEFIIDRTPPAVDIGFPTEGSKLRGGHEYEITWSVQEAHLHSTPISIRYARSPDGEWTTIAEHLPDRGSFVWTTPQDMTATGSIEVVAADQALNRGSAAVGNLVIDAIAPSRTVLGPAISATRSFPVRVRATDAGPAGLASIQLHVSADDGKTWSTGETVTAAPFEAIPFTAPADGTYLLDVVATDRAGNANPAPTAKGPKTFEVLVDTQAPTIALATAKGVRGVDGAAEGRRTYKPGDAVEVAFTVKDATVGADGVSVLWQAQTDARWEPLGSDLPPDAPFRFTIPDLSTTTARVKVVAVDVAGNTGEVVARETIVIDNEVEGGSVDVDL